MVLGLLLLEGIQCFKAYTNFTGYDLVAVHKQTGKSARIQVKSRWATDSGKAFPIKNFDCDFVVFAALNRGIRYRMPKNVTNELNHGRRDPDFYCFPAQVIVSARRTTDSWSKVSINSIADVDQYKSAWHLIKTFLDSSTVPYLNRIVHRRTLLCRCPYHVTR